MKISLRWLKDYLDFNPKFSLQEIVWRLTESTAAIEVVEERGAELEHVIVGELVHTKKHPNADHLSIGQIKINSQETIQIIYGERASVKLGDKIPVALAPCKLPGGNVESKMIRGERSEGMLCLDSELDYRLSDSLTKFDKSTKIGSPVVDIMLLRDTIFEIDNHSLTHRADLFSHLGFARECVALDLAIWKKATKDIFSHNVKEGRKKLPLRPMFENKMMSQCYFGTVIEGLSKKDSPLWLRRRLEAVGIRPLTAIIDITNYVMMELGQPIHAFDLRILKGRPFRHRISKKGELIITLDGTKRILDDSSIVVDNGKDIVDLCGIMGAQNSSIQDNTHSIYLHSCHYDAVLIRKTMMQLGHRTEAGTIFEKNIEPERAEQGFMRALELIKNIFPNARFSYKWYSHRYKRSPKTRIILPKDKIKKHIGIEITSRTIKKILEKLGFLVYEKKHDIHIQVPAWRTLSVLIPEDVIEEIIRIVGYSTVPAIPPTVELNTLEKNKKMIIKRVIQSFLITQNFLEEVNFSFLSESLLNKLNYRHDNPQLVKIANPVNDDFRFMRPNLLSYLLQNINRNQSLTSQEWKTFEIGFVYKKLDNKIKEEDAFNIVIANEQKETAFYDAKGIVENLFKELSIDLKFEVFHYHLNYPGRCLQINVSDQILGYLYELHPLIKQNFKLNGTIAIIEIFLDQLIDSPIAKISYRTINRNPEALLDLSVVVDEKKSMADVEQIIYSVQPQWIKAVQFVEVYQGKNIESGKKSLTFSLSYQHPNRTLNEKEIQDILTQLIKKVQASGGVVRQ